MHHLNRLSYAIVVLGVLTIVAAIAASLSPVWVLIGLMLLVAGLVKVAVVFLWRTVAQFDEESGVRGQESEERRQVLDS